MSPKCLCNSSSLSSSLVQPTCFQSVYFCLSSSLLTAQGCFYDSHNSRSSIIMNESVSRIITNDTIKFVSQTAISIVVISNHNSLIELLPYIFLKILLSFPIETLRVCWVITVVI